MSANEIFTNATFNIIAGMGTVVMIALSIVGIAAIAAEWSERSSK